MKQVSTNLIFLEVLLEKYKTSKKIQLKKGQLP